MCGRRAQIVSFSALERLFLLKKKKDRWATRDFPSLTQLRFSAHTQTEKKPPTFFVHATSLLYPASSFLSPRFSTTTVAIAGGEREKGSLPTALRPPPPTETDWPSPSPPPRPKISTPCCTSLPFSPSFPFSSLFFFIFYVLRSSALKRNFFCYTELQSNSLIVCRSRTA